MLLLVLSVHLLVFDVLQFVSFALILVSVVLVAVVLLTDDDWEVLDTTSLDEVWGEYHLPDAIHVLFCSA